MALLQGNKAKPQGPCKGFSELPPTELLLPRNRSHEAERKPQSSFRAAQEPFTSQPQGVRSWAVNKLLFTTQSRARRTISLRDGRRNISIMAGFQISSNSTTRLLDTSVGATQGMTTPLLWPQPTQGLPVSSFGVQTGISLGHGSAKPPYAQDQQAWRENCWSKFPSHIPQSNTQPRSILCR